MAKLVASLILVWLTATAKTSAQINPAKVNYDMINFFAGGWQGQGEFANGRKISAFVRFKLSLDSCWLVNEHQDEPPNKYKAMSVWGNDKITGKFVAYTFDNFQGHRNFLSEGWNNGEIVLTTHQQAPDKTLVYQHFVYQKLDTDRFKMTFEISKDSLTWKMVDYLIFKRK